MKRQALENVRIEGLLRQFFSRGPLEESTLTLEGTGINAAIQWVVLSMIGKERLRKIKFVNAISGSTFPLLLYLARESGDFVWPRERAYEWEPHYRKMHGVVPIWTALRWCAGLVVRKPALDVEGHAAAFCNSVREGFADQNLKDFDVNIRVWLYEIDSGTMVCAHRDSSLGDMKLYDIIKCSSGIPWLFGAAQYEGKSYIDPIYSPKMTDLRRSFKSEASNSLISNMLIEKVTPKQIFLKPHGYRYGSLMMFRDFAKFILGFGNREVGDAGVNGLFDTEPIEFE